MVAEIYFAVRHEAGVSVKGRVLLAREWPRPTADDPGWVNLFQMIRRWCTPERPYTLLDVRAGGATRQIRADREGYFEVEMTHGEAPGDEVVIEFPESEVSRPTVWNIDAPAESPNCVILSDVDDTVLVTHAGKYLQMIATTLLGNALTRQLFPGVARLYTALRRGPVEGSDRRNPLAYVTSSPYNLHGLIELIFEENGLPSGPFFMTDWGLDEHKWLTRSHRHHKLDAIRRVLAWYPDKPAILIGDTSQHDVPIYVEAAQEFPGRIAMILIHRVSSEKRIEMLRPEFDRLAGSTTSFHFFTDHAEAAELLAEAGWISQADRDEVGELVRKKPETLAERVVHHLTGDESDDPW